MMIRTFFSQIECYLEGGVADHWLT